MTGPDESPLLFDLDTEQPDAAHEAIRLFLRRAFADVAAQQAALADQQEHVGQVSDSVNLVALAAEEIEPGAPWRQPAGAHDAYPRGFVVAHAGKTWESTTLANVWEPGVSGWREIVPDDAPPPEWVAPTGAHDAYRAGDRVTFQGAVYESTVDANVWAPDVYGWTRL